MRLLTTISQLLYLGRTATRLVSPREQPSIKPTASQSRRLQSVDDWPKFFPPREVLAEANDIYRNVLFIWSIYDDYRGIIIGPDCILLGYTPSYHDELPYACMRLSDVTPDMVAYLRRSTGKCIGVEKFSFQSFKP